jgi:hypothetical protein
MNAIYAVVETTEICGACSGPFGKEDIEFDIVAVSDSETNILSELADRYIAIVAEICGQDEPEYQEALEKLQDKTVDDILKQNGIKFITCNNNGDEGCETALTLKKWLKNKNSKFVCQKT